MENILFVSAQPDVPYFIWQIKLYVHNFIEKGIKPDQIHVVLGLVQGKTKPSPQSEQLKELGINIHYFVDERARKHYIPSIKPYLISKWIQSNPDHGKLFFLHDADIILNQLPSFDELLQDEVCYLSDTIAYIGYGYIMDCCGRYEQKHPNTEKGQLISEMADVIGIDVNTIKDNQENSGGGQYLIKNSNCELWDKIYKDSIKLYDQMLNYQKRFPINPGQIQFWTAEMWSLLWNLWMYGFDTKITNEMSFSWATDNIKKYEQHPILHMAGVTDNLKTTKFYKGDYINTDPILKMRENPNHFDYIDKDSSTIKYIENMKTYIQKYNI
jgi:hypothetical protein